MIVKVDADIDFDPDFFEVLIGRFEADEQLGIASGTCYEQRGRRVGAADEGRRRRSGAPRAPTARDCLADLRRSSRCMGWDGLDEISVQLRGMRTQTFVDLPFRHHRPEGGRELTSLHQGEALGRAAWYMGYRPTYLTLRALYRARREPAALGMLWGYFGAAGPARAAVSRRAPRATRCGSGSGCAPRCGAAPRGPELSADAQRARRGDPRRPPFGSDSDGSRDAVAHRARSGCRAPRRRDGPAAHARGARIRRSTRPMGARTRSTRTRTRAGLDGTTRSRAREPGSAQPRGLQITRGRRRGDRPSRLSGARPARRAA